MGVGGYLSRCDSCRRLQADHARPARAGAAPSAPITWPLAGQPLPGAPSCSRPKLRGGGGAEAGPLATRQPTLFRPELPGRPRARARHRLTRERVARPSSLRSPPAVALGGPGG